MRGDVDALPLLSGGFALLKGVKGGYTLSHVRDTKGL